MAGLQSEKKSTADGTHFRGCVCPSSSLPSEMSWLSSHAGGASDPLQGTPQQAPPLTVPPAGGEALSYITCQELRCVLSWFESWGPVQRQRFLEDLVSKAVPGKLCSLLGGLSLLQVRDRAPSIFECQLRLWTQWFETWSEEERNEFLRQLEGVEPAFVARFYQEVAGTAGKD
ncbi:UNVERIFIED_CONTAM: hypothetical protein FKN15_059749 [Acipenser sinensis]